MEWDTAWLATHRVDVLSRQDAGAILCDWAGPAAGTPDEATTLAERLGGLALALRIVGSSLRRANTIPAVFAAPDTIRTFAGYRATLDRGEFPAAFSQQRSSLTEPQAREIVAET